MRRVQLVLGEAPARHFPDPPRGPSSARRVGGACLEDVDQVEEGLPRLVDHVQAHRPRRLVNVWVEDLVLPTRATGLRGHALREDGGGGCHTPHLIDHHTASD